MWDSDVLLKPLRFGDDIHWVDLISIGLAIGPTGLDRSTFVCWTSPVDRLPTLDITKYLMANILKSHFDLTETGFFSLENRIKNYSCKIFWISSHCDKLDLLPLYPSTSNDSMNNDLCDDFNKHYEYLMDEGLIESCQVS